MSDVAHQTQGTRRETSSEAGKRKKIEKCKERNVHQEHRLPAHNSHAYY
jgi:hypothetical protein